MGWHLRTPVRMGPVRVTVSKRGMGCSVVVRMSAIVHTRIAR